MGTKVLAITLIRQACTYSRVQCRTKSSLQMIPTLRWPKRARHTSRLHCDPERFLSISFPGVSSSLNILTSELTYSCLIAVKYIPKWLPGAGFQAIAAEGARFSHDLRYRPYADAKKNIVKHLSFAMFLLLTCFSSPREQLGARL